MTNFEKYKDEIIKIVRNGKYLFFDKKTKTISECGSIDSNCDRCQFNEDCLTGAFRWLFEEYQDPKLTKAERNFCEMVKVGYIARDKDGTLEIYEYLPTRNSLTWFHPQWKKINPNAFSFITWESGKAWSIGELLELEVEEND